ncbi:MAG: DUF1993 domain-containing protein [Gammaproteobacteria bacterium]|nr:DUF1993 domain-containing protein [Gammaproteobacteria bacterium]NHN38233.1 DUF1993 domain-containing protein [Pseudomaricurvus alcaniphilus]
MAFSMYELTVPVLQQGLGNLAGCLAKASAHCKDNNIQESALLNFRFYPDMYPYVQQVQTAADTAIMAASRLAGEEPALLPQEETDFAGLIARVEDARAKLKAIQPEQLAGSESKSISFTAMNTYRISFKNGADYLQKFILPNFYFHCTTAYDMLRHNGLPLGKRDFIGDFGADMAPL